MTPPPPPPLSPINSPHPVGVEVPLRVLLHEHGFYFFPSTTDCLSLIPNWPQQMVASALMAKSVYANTLASLSADVTGPNARIDSYLHPRTQSLLLLTKPKTFTRRRSHGIIHLPTVTSMHATDCPIPVELAACVVIAMDGFKWERAVNECGPAVQYVRIATHMAQAKFNPLMMAILDDRKRYKEVEEGK